VGVTFVTLATGGTSTCGLDGAGQTYCWGNNGNGQLGNGTTTSSLLPVAVSQPSGVTFVDVRAGSSHTCALDGNGQAWCWGRNNFAQMGDGTTTQRTSPVAVSH
jgi:alpha-tubulin suppressor-like RCC1 family protein